MMARSTNQVCEEYADKKTKIALRLLDGEEDTLLIEGGREGLRFLGELLLAQADADDCGFQLSPRGAGKQFFSPSATLGVYIHRVHQKSNGKQAQGVGKVRRSKLPH